VEFPRLEASPEPVEFLKKTIDKRMLHMLALQDGAGLNIIKSFIFVRFLF
jgi:hypothetical protein